MYLFLWEYLDEIYFKVEVEVASLVNNMRHMPWLVL